MTFDKGPRNRKRLGRFRVQGWIYILVGTYMYYTHYSFGFFFINLLTGRAPKQVSNVYIIVSRSSLAVALLRRLQKVDLSDDDDVVVRGGNGR